MSIVSDQVRLYKRFITKFLFKKDEFVVHKIALFSFTFCTDKMSMSFGHSDNVLVVGRYETFYNFIQFCVLF